MADALISPGVGATMWAATAVTTVYCAKKVREEADPAKTPLMGVTGAFIFAAQMLNFSIPGTGSSGHLGGGLILAILLGPEAALLVIASVLTVQALFFADGGLLALGCNIFNLGFFPVFLAYPFVYKKIAGAEPKRVRLVTGSVLGALVGLTTGALGVVLETTASGVSELPFATFAAMMVPIHLAIGLIEGLVTAAVVVFVQDAQPEILKSAARNEPLGGAVARSVIVGLIVVALLVGGAWSWFASADPDGLEWSIAKVTGSEELEGTGAIVHETAASVQEKSALLPDYGFRGTADAKDAEVSRSVGGSDSSTAGIVGVLVTLTITAGVGVWLTRRARREQQ